MNSIIETKYFVVHLWVAFLKDKVVKHSLETPFSPALGPEVIPEGLATHDPSEDPLPVSQSTRKTTPRQLSAPKMSTIP